MISDDERGIGDDRCFDRRGARCWGSETEQIACREQAGVILGVFSSQYSTECKSLAAVGIVGDGNLVGLGIITDAVDARHLIPTDGSDRQLVRSDLVAAALRAVGCVLEALYPFVLAVEAVDDVRGKRIGVQLGTTGDTLAHKITGASVVQLPATSNVMQELNARRIDAAIMDNGPATQYLATNPNLTMLARDLTKEDYAIAIKKGNTELLKQVNDSIEAMKKDGRYDALVKKHFGAVAP